MIMPRANGLLVPAEKRWSRLRAGNLLARKHLRACPAQTRPNLFAGD
jgi:hypothetical protein